MKPLFTQTWLFIFLFSIKPIIFCEHKFGKCTLISNTLFCNFCLPFLTKIDENMRLVDVVSLETLLQSSSHYLIIRHCLPIHLFLQVLSDHLDFSTILNTCWLFFLICHSTWSPQWLQPSYCFFDLMACFYLHSQYLCCLLFVFQFYCGYYWVLGNPSFLFLRLKFQKNFFFVQKKIYNCIFLTNCFSKVVLF